MKIAMKIHLHPKKHLEERFLPISMFPYIYIFHLLVYVSTLKVVTFKRSLYSHVHSLPFTVRLICEALVITEFTGSAD